MTEMTREQIVEARRVKFEEWARKTFEGVNDYSLRRNEGGYESEVIHMFWKARNDALDSLVIELPDEQPGCMFYAPDVVFAIEAQGVKVKQ